jgi:hypothetical protein
LKRKRTDRDVRAEKEGENREAPARGGEEGTGGRAGARNHNRDYNTSHENKRRKKG